MGFHMTGYRDNNTLYDRVNKLLKSYEWSDCNFFVCGKKFKAHKLILGITSPVFEAMFYGPLSNNEDVTITDVEPNIFDMLLTYIYTDKVEIKSVDEAYELMYASRKYMLEYLTETCAAYLVTNINIDNVINILNYPEYMQDKEVVSCALQLFCQHIEYFFREHKADITYSCMQKVIKNLEMNITEKDLIKHVYEWTSYYCEQNGLENTIENRREVLDKNDIFKYLRFYSLCQEDLNEIINLKENLLSSKEISDLIKHDTGKIIKNDKNIASCNRNFNVRKPIKLHWGLCRRTPIRSECPLVINQNNALIEARIKSTKSIFLSSLNVPSRSSPIINYCNTVAKTYCEQFTITIFCEDENTLVREIVFKMNVDHDSLIDIRIDNPILLNMNQIYRISFSWPRHVNYYPHYYAVQKRDKFFVNDSVKIHFEDVLCGSLDGGSFLVGIKYSI